jgi:hypothetical protein
LNRRAVRSKSKSRETPAEAALSRLEKTRFKSPEDAQAALLQATIALSDELAPEYEEIETGQVTTPGAVQDVPDVQTYFELRHPIKSLRRTKRTQDERSKINELIKRYVDGARRLYDEFGANEFSVQATIGLPPSASVTLTWRK